MTTANGVNMAKVNPPDTSARDWPESMATPLQAARHKRGWSQSRLIWELNQLASRKGCSLPTLASLKTLISRWENGHATPSFYQAPFVRALPGQAERSRFRVAGNYPMEPSERETTCSPRADALKTT